MIFSETITGFGSLAIDDDGEEVFEEFQFPKYSGRGFGEDIYKNIQKAKARGAALFSQTAEAWLNQFLSRTNVLNNMFASTMPAFNDAVYDSVFRSNSILDTIFASQRRSSNALQRKINDDLMNFSLRNMPPEMGEQIQSLLVSAPPTATEIARQHLQGKSLEFSMVDQVDQMQPSNWIWDQAAYPAATTILMRNTNPQGQVIDEAQMHEVNRGTYSAWRNAAQQAPPFNGLAAMRRMAEVAGFLTGIPFRVTENPRQSDTYETIFRDGIMYYRKSREAPWVALVPNEGVRTLLDRVVSSIAPLSTPRSM